MEIRIIRKIDALGRIVIPKDVRRSFNLRSGDNIEFFVEKNAVIIKKNTDTDKIHDIEEQ